MFNINSVANTKTAQPIIFGGLIGMSPAAIAAQTVVNMSSYDTV